MKDAERKYQEKHKTWKKAKEKYDRGAKMELPNVPSPGPEPLPPPKTPEEVW